MAEPMNGLHEQTVFISKDSVQEMLYMYSYLLSSCTLTNFAI
jgi:hypothetical protein